MGPLIGAVAFLVMASIEYAKQIVTTCVGVFIAALVATSILG